MAKQADEKEVLDFPLSLDEFCLSLSKTDRRVELIGGFHSDERQNGHIKDTRAAYASRFNEFINAPA